MVMKYYIAKKLSGKDKKALQPIERVLIDTIEERGGANVIVLLHSCKPFRDSSGQRYWTSSETVYSTLRRLIAKGYITIRR